MLGSYNKGSLTISIKDVIRNYILGSDSWTFGDIMPRIVRHHNSAKEHGENSTQIGQLDKLNHQYTVKKFK